jgi:hypothetical protein
MLINSLIKLGIKFDGAKEEQITEILSIAPSINTDIVEYQFLDGGTFKERIATGKSVDIVCSGKVKDTVASKALIKLMFASATAQNNLEFSME